MKHTNFLSPIVSLLASAAFVALIGCAAGTTTGGGTGGDTGSGGSGGSGDQAGAGGDGGGSSMGGATANGGANGGSVGSGGATAGSGGGAGSAGGTGGAGGLAGAAGPMACIVPIGDSITQGQLALNAIAPNQNGVGGTGSAANVYWFSYRYWLWKTIKDAGYNVNFVGSTKIHNNQPAAGNLPVYPDPAFDRDHEGHWGWTADMVRASLTGWVARYTPGIALVHLGHNDPSVMGYTPTRTTGYIRQIVGILRAKNPRVVVLLAQIIPYAANPQRDAFIDLLNPAIAALVTELDKPDSRVVLVDQHTGFNSATDTHELLHPNDAGEKKMAARWFTAIEPFLKMSVPCPDAT